MPGVQHDENILNTLPCPEELYQRARLVLMPSRDNNELISKTELMQLPPLAEWQNAGDHESPELSLAVHNTVVQLKNEVASLVTLNQKCSVSRLMASVRGVANKESAELQTKDGGAISRRADRAGVQPKPKRPVQATPTSTVASECKRIKGADDSPGVPLLTYDATPLGTSSSARVQATMCNGKCRACCKQQSKSPPLSARQSIRCGTCAQWQADVVAVTTEMDAMKVARDEALRCVAALRRAQSSAAAKSESQIEDLEEVHRRALADCTRKLESARREVGAQKAASRASAKELTNVTGALHRAQRFVTDALKTQGCAVSLQTTLKTQRDDAQGKCASQQAQITALQAQCGEASKRLAEYAADLQRCESDLAASRTAEQSTADQVLGLTTEVNHLSAEQARWQTEIAALHALGRQNIASDLKRLEKEASEGRSAVKRLGNALQRSKRTKEAAEQQAAAAVAAHQQTQKLLRELEAGDDIVEAEARRGAVERRILVDELGSSLDIPPERFWDSSKQDSPPTLTHHTPPTM